MKNLKTFSLAITMLISFLSFGQNLNKTAQENQNKKSTVFSHQNELRKDVNGRIQDLNATRSVNIVLIKFSFLFQIGIISE